MSEPGLHADGVSFLAGERRLVDRVSLALVPGQVTALVGPNGAGKSTLLKLLAGDLPPAEGAVTLDGIPLGGIKAGALARRRAVLPQQTALQFGFSAQAVVMFGRSPHLRGGGEGEHDYAVVEAAMRDTDTWDLAERAFPTLSGGEAQRVTLARVLAQEAAILLLDEPTAALDIHHQELIAALARELAGAGAAVLVVLHDLNLAARCADRVAVMHAGRLVALGEPWAVLTEATLSEVFAHPIAVVAHPVEDCPLIVPLRRSAEKKDRIGAEETWRTPCLSR